MIRFWKAPGLYLHNLQKKANSQKYKYLLRNLVIVQNMYKKCANCNKLYNFEMPLTQQIQICKNIFNIFKTKMCMYSRKTENVKIHFKSSCAKICAKFLTKIVQFASFVICFLKNYKMLKSNDCLNIDLVWCKWT